MCCTRRAFVAGFEHTINQSTITFRLGAWTMTTSPSSSPRRRTRLSALIVALLLGLFAFQGVVLAAALPTVTLSVPANVPIGANFNFTATFDSSGTIGYGPFIDLIFPATGV